MLIRFAITTMLFFSCQAHGQTTIDIDGSWISSVSQARALVANKGGNVVITMSYPSGHSDVYLGTALGNNIPNICSVKGVEPFYACFSASISSAALINLALQSCEDTQNLDICPRIPQSQELTREVNHGITGIWQITPEKYFHVDDNAGILSLVEIDATNGDTEDLTGTRNGKTGKVCSTDGDGICADITLNSESTMTAVIVSCDTQGACEDDPIGTIVNLTKLL